jgi:hypothetical protein
MSTVLSSRIQKMVDTLILLNISSTAMSDRIAGEVTAKNNDFWDEIIFDAIVEHHLQSTKCERMVQPDV